MREIKLTRGKVTLVDDADYEVFKLKKWTYATVGYAICSVGKKTDYMHRIIMNCPKGLTVDHIDGDKLNNQRSNLRVCKLSENVRNQGKRKVGTFTSKYKGVHWDGEKRKWKVEITVNYRNIFIGRRSDEIEAVRLYNNVASLFFGQYANFNTI